MEQQVISNEELLRKIEEAEAKHKEEQEKEAIIQRAINNNICPICGEKLVFDSTKICCGRIFLFFKIYKDKYTTKCSKDTSHYNEEEEDDLDDCGI